MIWFVISIILLLFSAAVTGVAMSRDVKGAGIGLIPGLVGLLLLIPACLYSVDVGEVAVIRNMGGSLAGHSEDAGFHWKTPWQSVIKYDTRNNLINFYKDTDYKYDGGSAVGKQVTVNDRSGASADIDIQVNYSLDPSAAEYLYSEYGKQQTFTQNYISNDLRSVAREQSGRFDTLTMLTNRGEYTKAVQDVLAAKWRKIGLTVEQVSVQDVRYPKEITSAYAAAQAAARKAQEQAESDLATAQAALAEAQAAVAAAEMHSAATRAKACLRSNAAYRAIPMKYAAASGLIQLPSASITPASAKFAHLDFGRTANAIAADIENANGSSEKYPTGRNQLLYAAA